MKPVNASNFLSLAAVLWAMKRLIAAIFITSIVGASLMFFSPLRIFNAITPVDRGIERVVSGAAYGNQPRQMLDVYRQAGRASGLPVLIFCYGGAWSSGDRNDYDFVGRGLAAQGYLVIIYDYRLVPDVRFPGFLEDTATVIAWAASNASRFGGESSRIFLAGHSAGAYNVAQVALDSRYLRVHGLAPDAIAAVAVLAGPFDFLPLDDPATIAAFSQAQDLPATQPVNAVTGQAPPFLLLTGDADTTVYPRNSRALAEHLRRASVPHRLIEYPGLGHAEIMLAMARPLRWRAPVLADIVGFFATIQASANNS
jgi:acetyl esterase/lipase